MNERLMQFLNAENITQAQFADSINVARAGVSHIIAGRNKPGWDFIINTMNRYPDLNIEWLLTGKGKMYKSPSSPSSSASLPFPNPDVKAPEDSVPQSFPSEEVELPHTDVQMHSMEEHPAVRSKVTKVIVFFDDGTFQEL